MSPGGDGGARPEEASGGAREFLLPLNRQNRTAAGVAAGEAVQLTVERDEEARVVEVLEDLAAALATDDAAGEAFAGLSYSHQRECAEWIGEARRAETRGRRVTQALERLRAGQTLR